MQVNGQEVMGGCVLKNNVTETYCKVIAVEGNKYLVSVAFPTANEAEAYFGSNVYLFTDYGLSNYHVCLYPVVSYDKNGKPLRYGDEVETPGGTRCKVIGELPKAVIIEDKIVEKGWNWFLCSEVTKLPKEEHTEEDIEEAIDILKKARIWEGVWGKRLKGLWEDMKASYESQNK